MQTQPQAISFIKPVSIDKRASQSSDKVKSFIEMEPFELEQCITTYSGEKEKMKRELRKQGLYQGKRLTKQQVFEILNSKETHTRLAAKYDTSISSIGFIKKGLSYRDYFREWVVS